MQADGEINAIFSLRIRRKRKIGEGRKKKFVYRSSEKKTIVVVDRRRISSGLVNSQARHPSTKILRCFSPVLVYTCLSMCFFHGASLSHRPLHRSVVLCQPLHGDVHLTPAPHTLPTLPPPPSSPHSRLAAYTLITFEPHECKSAQIDPRFSFYYRPVRNSRLFHVQSIHFPVTRAVTGHISRYP